LVIVFFLCGLWHGASWNFVIWGLFHGAFLVFERIGRMRSRIERLGPFAHLYAMLVVLLGWVLFRTHNMSQAIDVLRALFGLQLTVSNPPPLNYYLDSELFTVLLCSVIGSTPFIPWLSRQRLRLIGTRFSYVVLVVLFLVSLIRVSAESYSPFIYYRF
jgi:alginate O-acetyltransferase complex protein AlgI